MSNEALGVAGAVVVAASAVYYLVDIVRGGTRPHTGSWLVWMVVGILGFASSSEAGAGPGTYAAAVYVVIYTLIFLLSLHPKYGKRAYEWYDWPLCLITVLAVIAWHAGAISGAAAAAVAVAGDAAGLWPTLRESWRDPSSESVVAWTGDAIGNLLALFAVSAGSFAALAYPVYLLVATGLVALVLVYRRRGPTIGAAVAGAERSAAQPVTAVPRNVESLT